MGKLLIGSREELGLDSNARTITLKDGLNVTMNYANDRPVLNLAIQDTALKNNLSFSEVFNVVVSEEDHFLKDEVFDEEEVKKVLENKFNSLIEKTLNIKIEYASKEMIEQALKSIEMKFKNNIRMLFYYLLKDYLTESIYAYYQLNKNIT